MQHGLNCPGYTRSCGVPLLPRVLSRLSTFFARSVRGRLALMVIAIAVPAAMLGLVLVYEAYRNERDSVANHLLFTARALVSLVDRNLGESTLILKALSTSQALEGDNLPAFYARAKGLVPEEDRWVVLLDPTGRQLVNTRVPYGTPLPMVEIGPDFAQAMKAGRTYVSNLIYGPVANSQVVDVSYPVFRDGKLLYSIHLVMLPSALSRVLRVNQFAPQSVISILDRTGTIATRSLNAHLFVGHKATADVVAAVAASDEGVGTSVTLEGIPVVRAFSRSPLSGWSVVIGSPTSTLFSSARRLLWMGLAIAALLIAVAVGMASWIGHTLARTVEDLAEEANAIGRGVHLPSSGVGLVETDAVAIAMRRTADRLDLALAAARLGVWSWNADSDQVSLSPRGAEIFGTPRVTTWSKLRESLFPEDASKAHSAVTRSMATRTDYQTEYRVAVPGGGVRWVGANGRPFADESGAIVGMVGIVQDITDRRNAENTLRAQQEQLRLISLNAPVMLVHCDLNRRYLFANQAYADRMSLEPTELIGRTIEEVLGKDAHAALDPYIQRVLRGEAVEFELEVPLPQAGRRLLRVSYSPEMGDDGKVRGWLAAITDITDRQKAEAAERHLATIVQSSDDAIISKNLEGIVSSWNASAERMFGYSADEIVGQPITRLIPQELWSEEAEILERLNHGESIEHYETLRRRKDGRVIEVSLSVSPIKTNDGRIIGVSKIARDITQRKRAEMQQEALYQLAARVNRAEALPEIYEAALDAICRCQQASRAAILLKDNDGVMRFKAYRNLSEEYRRGVEGHSPWSSEDANPIPICIEDVTTAVLDPPVRAAVEREGIRSLVFIPLTYEKKLLGKFMVYYDEPHRFFAEELRPTEAMATQVAFALERQRNAEALEALVDERTTSLRKAVAQMHEFSYSVSHDLRAPVRAMRGYAAAVLEDYGDRLDDQGRALLARIQGNGDRMDRLIQDLLTYSRLTSPVKVEPVSLEKLFHEVRQQYPAMQPERADIEISEPLPTVLGHEPSLTQVVSNLLSNAVKFVAPGVRPRVVITAEQVNGSVRVSFRDNGIGISPQHQSRLFGMFERIHPDKYYEGTGIGLAIVRKAMERMNGSAGVQSHGYDGSTFWIEIPAAAPSMVARS